VSAPVDCVPLVVFEPDHAPDAAQLVALVLLHVSVELPPLAIDAGFAVSVTVGAGGVAVMVTMAEVAGVVPPAPVQVSV